MVIKEYDIEREIDDDIEELEDDLIGDALVDICNKIDKSIAVNMKSDSYRITISEYVFIMIKIRNERMIKITTCLSNDKCKYDCTRTTSEIVRVASDLQTAALVLKAINTKLK